MVNGTRLIEMPQEVTDSNLLEQLNAPESKSAQEVTDPALLEQLNASPPSLSWSDVPGQALSNIPGSAAGFVKSIAQPIGDVAELGARGIDWAAQKLGAEPRQPQRMETAENLGMIGSGVLQHLGLMKGNEYQPYADAVGKFLMDRYGSVEGIKRTLATDPVGLAADLSTILSAGGSLAARAPGVMGRTAEIASAAGRAVDPLNAAIQAAKGVTSAAGAAGNLTAGVMTHVGPRAFREAAQAGLAGGEKAAAFRRNITGVESAEEAVNAAQGALTKMSDTRGRLYQERMKDIRDADKPLDFSKIDKAMADIEQPKVYQPLSGGPAIPLSESTEATRQQIKSIVDIWRKLPERDHTAASLDALKQKLWNDVRVAPEDRAGHKILGEAYNAVRQTIIDEHPEYAKVMKGYEEASQQIANIRRELSLPQGPNKRNISTAFGKLTSALRNNVSTHYGRREELVRYLVDAGAPDLLPRLAGQELRPWLPRGLGKAIAGAGVEAGAAMIGMGAAPAAGALAATAPFMSPRLMGEAAYGSGVARRYIRKVPVGALGASRPIGAGALWTGRISGTSEGSPFIENPSGMKKGGRVIKSFRYLSK